MSRRDVLKLLASAIGIGPILVACRSAIEAATSTSTSTTLQPAVSTTSATTIAAVRERTATPHPEPAALEVIGREGWSSLPQGRFRHHTIQRITIHHTAVEIIDNAQAPARLRQHEEWHRSQGWPDLAYHFMVDRHGNVYEGRPIAAVGDTFTEYDPTGHFLACFEGNFDQQEPSADQIAAMSRLVAWAMQTFNVPPALVLGHRDWATTTCPGDNMYWRLPGLTRTAGDQPETGITYLRGEAARSRVAAISSGM